MNEQTRTLDPGQPVRYLNPEVGYDFGVYLLTTPGGNALVQGGGRERLIPLPLVQKREWHGYRTDVLEELYELIGELDDSTDLYDQVGDELDKRAADHEIKVNNGGVMP